MSEIQSLIRDIESARHRFLEPARGLSHRQGAFRPAPDRWCAAEVVEHLVLAEQVGVLGMWQAAEALRQGQAWEGDVPHAGASIEEVVARTWRAKETAPEVATPRQGGPLALWVAALDSCRGPLAAFGERLEGLDLAAVVYPHPLSGALDARQRLEFLRFHLDRHHGQLQELLADPAFPAIS